MPTMLAGACARRAAKLATAFACLPWLALLRELYHVPLVLGRISVTTRTDLLNSLISRYALPLYLDDVDARAGLNTT